MPGYEGIAAVWTPRVGGGTYTKFASAAGIFSGHYYLGELPDDIVTYVAAPDHRLTYEQLLAEVRGLSDQWHVMRVYRNYSGGLDGYYEFSGRDVIYHYTIGTPEVDASIILQWLLSGPKTLVAVYGIDDFNL